MNAGSARHVRGVAAGVEGTACACSPAFARQRRHEGRLLPDDAATRRPARSWRDSAKGYSLACAVVHDDTLYVFASRFEDNNWNDVTMFKSTDLKNWEQKVAYQAGPGRTSVQQFGVRRARRIRDGLRDQRSGVSGVHGRSSRSRRTSRTGRSCRTRSSARIATRRARRFAYANGYYYLLYLEHRTPRWFFETYIARSTDLKTWELSPLNPVLVARGHRRRHQRLRSGPRRNSRARLISTMRSATS